jgi:hypothetical protein
LKSPDLHCYIGDFSGYSHDSIVDSRVAQWTFLHGNDVKCFVVLAGPGNFFLIVIRIAFEKFCAGFAENFSRRVRLIRINIFTRVVIVPGKFSARSAGKKVSVVR